MSRTCLVVAVLTLSAAPAAAQERFALAIPDSAVSMTGDVQYAMSGNARLAMDVYRPAAKPAHAVPAVVFFHRAVGAESRRGTWPSGWARAAAARGLVGIVGDLRPGSETADFDLLVVHLASHASDLGIDGLVVMAGSGNVFTALPVIEDPKRTAVTAAVMLYGASPGVSQFRLDLPVLLVRAGLDRPALNQEITRIATVALNQNAPITVLNHPGGQHAFDVRDNDDASRATIERILQYVKDASAASYQAAVRAKLTEASAAGFMQLGKFKEAADAYAKVVATRPDDAVTRLAYAEALLGDKQYTAACDEFEKLRTAPLGPRDRGIPAAKACLGKGDPVAAVAWLSTIPARVLPPQTQEDPAFAALKDRPDFKALFERK